MTVRSLILGLLGAVFIAAGGYLNDGLLRNTFLIGNHFPVGVFGPLILLVLAVNPLLWLCCRSRRLQAKELAVVATLMLVACCIPSSGLMRTFTNTLVMPIAYDRIRPEWQTDRILSYVPDDLIPNAGRYDPGVVDGYLNGLPRPPGEAIGLGDIPWAAWRTPLLTWGALLVLTGIAVVCLSMIVHRQWSQREHLRYPVADFATALMGLPPSGEDRPVYRRRIFWMGLLLILAIRVLNGVFVYNPGSIEIPLRLDLGPITATWPKLMRLEGVAYLRLIRIYPTVVAFGFLLAAQVSFSLGIGPFLLAAASGVLLAAGVDTGGGYFTGGVFHWQRAGSYLALALMVLYTGRRYYGQVLKRALTFLPAREAEESAVWSCRILIVTVAAVVFLLDRLGLDWPIGLLMILLLLMMFTVMARINAESGMFFLQSRWQPLMVIIGLFGLDVLSPRVVAILAMLAAAFTVDPRECLMPFMVNGLRICDRVSIRPARVGVAGVGVFVLALAVAIPMGLWANYNYGIFRDDIWASERVPDMTYDMVSRAVVATPPGQLSQVDQMGPWERIRAARPDGRFLAATGVGLLLVLLVGAGRLRWPKFPLHPVLFLTWGTYPLGLFGYSFLFGWLIKSVVLKYGLGRDTYRRAAHFMYGAIAGDLLGALAFIIYGAASFAVTGQQPLHYMVFPG